MAEIKYINIDNIAIPVPATQPLTLTQQVQTSFSGVVNNKPTPNPADGNILGRRDHNFIDEVYNQIWVMDKSYNVGYVTQDYKTTVEVWNAYYVPKTLESITFDASQIDIETALSLPYSMRANSSQKFDLTVYAEGSQSINTNFNFVFSDQLVIGNVVGTRAIIFDMPHNWIQNFTESYTCFTDIIKTLDLSEQRFSLGEDPTYNCTYYYSLKNEERQKFDGMVYNLVDETVNIPLYVYNVYLSSGVLEGETFILVDDITDNIIQNNLQLRIDDRKQTEIVEVLSIVGNRLNLKKPITKAFTSGAVVTPIILGKITNVEKNGINTHYANYSVTFEKNIDNLDMLKTNSSVVADSIDGITYLNIAPNEELNIQTTYNNSKVIITNDYGIKEYYKYSNLNEIIFGFDYIVTSKQQLSLFKNTFNTLQGMWGDLYLNNFSNDVTVKKSILPSDTIIHIKNINASSNFKNKKIKYFAVNYGNNTKVFEILDIQAYDAETEYIVLPSNAGILIDINSVNYSSFIFRGRLNNDTLAFEYRTDAIVRTQVEFIKNIDVE